jgi:hypothetical protein
VAAGHDLVVLDVSEPATASIVGSLEDYGVAEVVMSGDVAYMGQPGGMDAIDLSDPSAPGVIGSCNVSFGRMLLEGNRLYVTTGDNPQGGPPSRFKIYDVTNMLDPVELGRAPAPPWGTDVDVVGDLAYITSGASGMHVYDISVETAPVLIGGGSVGVPARSVAVGSEFAYVAAGSVGLQLMPLQCSGPTAVWASGTDAPAQTVLLVASSNPFFGSADLRIGLHTASNVQLTIYDTHGRRVCGVFAGALTAGQHLIHWDGLNDRAQAVPRGVYFARLTTPTTSATTRLVVLR